MLEPTLTDWNGFSILEFMDSSSDENNSPAPHSNTPHPIINYTILRVRTDSQRLTSGQQLANLTIIIIVNQQELTMSNSRPSWELFLIYLCRRHMYTQRGRSLVHTGCYWNLKFMKYVQSGMTIRTSFLVHSIRIIVYPTRKYMTVPHISATKSIIRSVFYTICQVA